MSRNLAVTMTALSVGCGGGFKRILVTEERPAGTCATTKLASAEKCTRSARDYTVGTSLILPQGRAGDIGGSMFFRGPTTNGFMVDLMLDSRSLRRPVDSKDHQSFAGGIGLHLRPLIFWPHVFRYIDLNVSGGSDLGVIKFGRRIKGRFDGFVGASLEIYSPDLGTFRYLKNGVPGVRVGVRQTWYVEGWGTETTFNVGLVWRWGTPIDLLTTWQQVRTGD